MNPWNRLRIPAVGWSLVLVAVLVPACSGPEPPPPEVVSQCGPGWKVLGSQNPSNYNELRSVVAPGPRDAWAVGSQASGGTQTRGLDGGYMFVRGPDRPLIEHWDGASWRVVPSPGVRGALSSASAASPDDVWATGNESDLVEHWDGRRWAVIHPHAPGEGEASFTGVVALAPDDVWLVGYRTVNYLQTLAEHYDGHGWRVVATPGAADQVDFRLNAVTATSSDDVWAVGERYFRNYEHTLVEHWDGRRWSTVPSPNAPTTVPVRTGGLDYNYLESAAAVSPNDVWAVGFHDRAGAGRLQALAEHWDGHAWSLVPTPERTGNVGLNSVMATQAGVWAVGSHLGGGLSLPFAMRWGGRGWASIRPCNFGTDTSLSAVTPLPTGVVMAVGVVTTQSEHHQGSRTLIEQYVGD